VTTPRPAGPSVDQRDDPEGGGYLLAVLSPVSGGASPTEVSIAASGSGTRSMHVTVLGPVGDRS
jgi:hypothetical protein